MTDDSRPEGLMIAPEVIEKKIKRFVALETSESLREFISDAINSYIELGRLVAEGGTLLLQAPDRAEGDLIHLRLPFEALPDRAGE